MTILAIEVSNKAKDLFLLFDDTGSLWLSNAARTDIRHIAQITSITAFAKPISMTLHEPYACIVERFGLNGAVVDLMNGSIREGARSRVHANRLQEPRRFRGVVCAGQRRLEIFVIEPVFLLLQSRAERRGW
jgi:hypothetical protein